MRDANLAAQIPEMGTGNRKKGVTLTVTP